jgi:beta-alanine degradation protein BauB
MEETAMTPPTERVGTRLLFENDRVRVWDLSVAPGESLEKHAHRLDYLIIVESGGLIRFDDPDDPSDVHDVQYEDDQVVFREVTEAKIDNRLTNVGQKRHRNFVIELKG